MSVDRGYLNLVSHLSRTSSTAPIEAIHGSIAHYLARVQPSATPLAALVISSPLLRTFSFASLDGLSTAFRHAVHLRIKVLEDEPTGIFSRGLATRMADWVGEVLKGLQGGYPVLRLACCSGLLQGLHDREKDLKMQNSTSRRRVEEEFVIALAEVLDLAPSKPDAWEAEFRSVARAENDDLVPVALVIASRVTPVVAPTRLKALPLAALCSTIHAATCDAFQQGRFLSLSKEASVRDDHLSIPNDSVFARNIEALSKSLIVSHMATLSAMYAQLLSILADHRPADAWVVAIEHMQALNELTQTAEKGWTNNPLAAVEDESSLAPDTQDLSVKIWTILKTLLFTSIRLIHQTLTVALYVPPPSTAALSPSYLPSQAPFALAHLALRTLAHLSFVLPHFGGVSSTAATALPEMLRAFYTALDVLAASPAESAVAVRQLRMEVAGVGQAAPRKVAQAKEAYALAAVEQLVPVLDDKVIQEDVYPLCEPHLNDPSHRETYESAHSVMLAVFSAHAKKVKAGDAAPASGNEAAFAERVVPAYAHCLIQNSGPEKLNSTQLRMAYRALVGCASAFGSQHPRAAAMEAGTDDAAVTSGADGDAYAWFCIDLLLGAIRTHPRGEHRQKLLLALVSTVSAVSLRTLPRLLEAVLLLLQEEVRESEDGDDDAGELVQTLFEELLNVGDEEKEYAIWWWGEHKVRLQRVDQEDGREEVDVKGKGKERETTARL